MQPRQYSIHPGITENEMKNQLFMDRRIFLNTAKQRFSLLDRDYFCKKAQGERFPLEGNISLAKAIAKSIPESGNGGGLLILDVGAAGGALTTLCLLNELPDAARETARLVLLDISREALKTTVEWGFELPIDLLESEYGWTGGFLEEARKAFSRAETIEADITAQGGAAQNILRGQKADICVSGFTHHHMNLFDKEIAVERMEGFTKAHGLIGIVDESLSHADYVGWIKSHSNERNSRGEAVPIALESFIGLEEHEGMLKESRIIAKSREREYYYFVAKRI